MRYDSTMYSNMYLIVVHRYNQNKFKQADVKEKLNDFYKKLFIEIQNKIFKGSQNFQMNL